MLTWPPQSHVKPMPARYRLVALDLDSTLQPDGTIHPADAAAVRTAHAVGVKVVLVSARSPRAMHRYWAQLGLGTPVIALNGALVYDFPTHKHILGQPIESDTVQQVLHTVNELAPKATIGLECGERWAVNRLSRVTNWQLKQTGQWPWVIGDLTQCLERPVYQIWVSATPEQLQALEKRLAFHAHNGTTAAEQRPAVDDQAPLSRASNHLALMRYTDPDLLILRSAAASRGWAVSALANWLEIPSHQVMAIGDGGRDRSMLQAAAFAVVTSGVEGPGRPKETSGTIVSTKGVAEALELCLYPR